MLHGNIGLSLRCVRNVPGITPAHSNSIKGYDTGSASMHGIRVLFNFYFKVRCLIVFCMIFRRDRCHIPIPC